MGTPRRSPRPFILPEVRDEKHVMGGPKYNEPGGVLGALHRISTFSMGEAPQRAGPGILSEPQD